MRISLSKGMRYSKYFSLILQDDYTVWGMGSNFFGQLGLNGPGAVTRQTRITALDPVGDVFVTDIKAGNLHSVALKSDGTLWGFGLNMTGALGSLRKGPVLIPEQIQGISGITTIDAAGDSTYALSAEGLLTVLSNNGVKTIDNVSHVYAGSNHCFIKMTDGTFRVFGDNTCGAFGDGSTQSSTEPVEALLLNDMDVISISPGNSHTAVLCNGGRVLCCGDNANGQLGVAGAKALSEFVEVTGKDVVSIASGGYHTLLLNKNGELFAFGFNFFGQLGDGSALQRLTPVKVLDNIEAIAAGTFHSLAATGDGRIFGFGSNDFGQLGDGTLSQKTSPFKVSTNNLSVASVAGGLYNTALLTTDGALYMNGCNLYGQLGNKTLDKGTHLLKKVLDDVREMECGGTHTAAIVGDNSLYIWGNNSCGQSGNGSTDVNEDGKLGGGEIRNLPVPTKIKHGLSYIKACVCGENHTLLLDEKGGVYAAGLNNVGQLGDGSTHNKNMFQKIDALPLIKNIYAHKFHNAAIDLEGGL